MRRVWSVVLGCSVILVCMAVIWTFVRQDHPVCRVGYVYDGDTVAMDCERGEETARVMGFDTPETVRARCEAEAALGKAATERLRALVAGGAVRISRHGRDKYRRALIRMWIDGRDVADIMVREELAVRYSGGKRIDWCARLAR